eukprot:3847437-Rhodomonas_salina.2
MTEGGRDPRSTPGCRAQQRARGGRCCAGPTQTRRRKLGACHRGGRRLLGRAGGGREKVLGARRRRPVGLLSERGSSAAVRGGVFSGALFLLFRGLVWSGPVSESVGRLWRSVFGVCSGERAYGGEERGMCVVE